MRESKIESYLKAQVERHGGKCYKWVSPGCTGVPDRIVFFQSAVFLVELKQENGRLSPRQIAVKKDLSKLGFEVVVLKTKAQVKLWVELQASNCLIAFIKASRSE